MIQMLSADEQYRAARYHFPEHRKAFVLRRGFLRLLLSRYIATPPEDIRFSYGIKGKPRLVIDHRIGSSCQPIDFNLSRCEDLTVCAVAADCDLGVDIERFRPIVEAQAIAERFFSAPESTELAGLAEGEKPEAFLNCWTRKEAYVKALGDGLSAPLDSFRVSLIPGQPVELRHLNTGSREKKWILRDVRPAPDYVGALAFKRPDRELRMWNFTTMEEAIEQTLLGT